MPRSTVFGAVRTLLAEPRPTHPPRRVWRDWLVVAAVAASLAVEVLVRAEVRGPVAVGSVVLLAVGLLWRRTAPLSVVALVFGALAVASIADLAGVGPALPNSLAWVLVLPYALLRWGSGRDAAVGLAIMLVTASLGLVVEFAGPLDAGLGFAILLLPAAVGAAVRFRAGAREDQLEQVRLRERQQLARELHDTVAHHVSAIVVQAQAGQAVAVTNPATAVETLRVIEQAATRTLEEMRATVGALRAGTDADPAPRGVGDLTRLTEPDGGPRVALHVSGDLDDLGPALGATVYRIAQEAVTNAGRHARHARRVDLRVAGEPDRVCVTVRDDGEPGSAGQRGRGYGLTGMRERAALLGGTLDAGPAPDGGWLVHAVLPRTAGPR